MLFEEAFPFGDTFNAMNRLRQLAAIWAMNVIIYPLLILWTGITILLFPLAYLLWKVITGWSTERIVRHFIWLYGRGWLAMMSPFVEFRRDGFDSLKEKLPVILVVNHFSFFDIYCMTILPFHNVAFTIRSWPFRMFWYAPFMRLANYLDVQRLGWEKTTKLAKEVLNRKGSVLFFPEGHRSRDGKLGRFYSGAFRLSIETGVLVVPVCISGTDELLPPSRWWMKPARIRLRALPPFDPRNFSGATGHMEMKKAVKEAVERNLIDMRNLNR